MICEYYHNHYEHALEDAYIKANLGGCVHCECTKAERLSRLKEGDILVVANAATLNTDPVNLLWAINHLSHRGVHIHFVEENLVIRGNACDQTSHVVEKILSLFCDSPSSHSCGLALLNPLPAAAVHGSTHGRVECDPYLCGGSRRQELKEEDLAAKANTSRHLDAGDFSQKDLKIKLTKEDQSHAQHSC